MEKQTRDWIAGAVAAISLALSLVVLLFGGYDPGFRIAPSDGGLVVTEVGGDVVAVEVTKMENKGRGFRRLRIRIV